MQLRKPIAPRSQVSPDTIELILKIADDRWEKMQQTFEVRSRLRPEDIKLATSLQPLVKRSTEAIDRIKADLLGAPYEKFGATQYRDRLYLYGHTKPIVATTFRLNHRGSSYNIQGEAVGYYDLGPYNVVVDIAAFQTRRMDHVHLIPDREPLTSSRHFHHVARGSYSYIPSGVQITNPLDLEPSWCMASFASIFMDLLGTFDVAAYFKILHKFLCTYNQNSPLAPSLPHMRRVEHP